MENFVLNLERDDAETVSASAVFGELGDGDRAATATDAVVQTQLGRVQAGREALPLRLEGGQTLAGGGTIGNQARHLGLDLGPRLGQRRIHLREPLFGFPDLVDERIRFLLFGLERTLHHLHLRADRRLLAEVADRGGALVESFLSRALVVHALDEAALFDLHVLETRTSPFGLALEDERWLLDLLKERIEIADQLLRGSDFEVEVLKFLQGRAALLRHVLGSLKLCDPAACGR